MNYDLIVRYFTVTYSKPSTKAIAQYFHYFVRSGDIYYGKDVQVSESDWVRHGLRVLGQYGYYWSLIPGSVSNVAYYLSFSGSGVSPSSNGAFYDRSRYSAYSLRCLAS